MARNSVFVRLSITHVIVLLNVQTTARAGVHITDTVLPYTMGDIIESVNKTGIDFSILLNEYNKICPTPLSQCTPCSRGPGCWKSQSCCADVPYAYLKLGCANLTIMGNTGFSQMINGCPLHFGGEDELNVLCASNTSETAPVTSGELDFKNKHCAECHGVKVYEPWYMVLKCKQPIPRDIEITNMLEETLRNLGCIAEIERNRYLTEKVPCKHRTTGGYIGFCNVTGLWEEVDQSLKWACETLDNLPYFGIFKNMFCYLCNPSIASTTKRQPVKSCSYSARCAPETYSKRLAPYGNWCLVICDGVDGRVRTLDVTTNDTVAVVTREYVNRQTGQSHVHIQLRGLYTSDIFGAIKAFLIDVYGDDIFLQQDNSKDRFGDRKQGMNISISELLRTYTAICGDRLVCDKSLMDGLNADKSGNGDEDADGDKESNQRNFGEAVDIVKSEPRPYQLIKRYRVECNNDQNCTETVHFPHRMCVPVDTNPVCGKFCFCGLYCLQGKTCCVDLLLQKEPFSCYGEDDYLTIYPLDSNYSSSKIEGSEVRKDSFGYSLVSGCLKGTSNYLFNMCVGTANNVDSLSYIPVESNNVQYKNIYCLLCNMGQNIYDAVVSIELECDSYLETYLFPDLRSMLQVARNHCKTNFIPKDARRCRKQYTTERTGKFYTSGTNTSFTISEVKIISKCNETGFWSENNIHIQRICEGKSESILRLPEYRIDSKVYKNFACFECNPEISTYEIDASNAIDNCTLMMGDESCVLKQLCKDRPFHERWHPYKNLFCSLCNRPGLKLLKACVEAAGIDVSPTAKGPNGGGYVESYTYRRLFHLAPVSPRSDPAAVVTCDGIYDTAQRYCRELQCGKDRVLVNGSCRQIQPVRFLTHPVGIPSLIFVRYLMRIRVRPAVTNTIEDTDTVLLETLCNDPLSNMFDNFRSNMISVLHDCTVYNVSCDTANITIDILSSIVLSYTIRVSDLDLEYVEQSLVDGLSASYDIETTSGNTVSLRASPVSQNYVLNANISRCSYEQLFGTRGILMYVDKFMKCPLIFFNETDIHRDIDSGSITVRQEGTRFSADDFKHFGHTFAVCMEDYNISKRPELVLVRKSAYDKAYAIFNNVCVILSLICLLLTFITFAIFQTLRSIPGKNIMTLTSALFLAQLQIQIAPFVRTGTLTCAIIGASIHYFWLSTFCAMCACSFHIFKLFYIGFMTPHNQHTGNNFTVAKYNTCVFGLPLGVISVFIVFNMVATNGRFSGYGAHHTCFLTGFYSVLLAFVLPSSLLTVASITLFSMSFHRIRTAPHMRGQRDRQDVVIYIKLCTIVGITWPLQVVDGFLELSFLSFIAVGLNALQGVFIFVAYVCNARIFGLYKGLLVRNPSHSFCIP